jgi:hypothetical protein
MEVVNGGLRTPTRYIVWVMKWLRGSFEFPDIEQYILRIWFRIPDRKFDDRRDVYDQKSIGNNMWIDRKYRCNGRFYGIIQYDQCTGSWSVLDKEEVNIICVCGGRHLSALTDEHINIYAYEHHCAVSEANVRSTETCGKQARVFGAFEQKNLGHADIYGCWYCVDRAKLKYMDKCAYYDKHAVRRP